MAGFARAMTLEGKPASRRLSTDAWGNRTTLGPETLADDGAERHVTTGTGSGHVLYVRRHRSHRAPGSLQRLHQRGALWLLRSGRQSDSDYEYAVGDPVTSFDLDELCSIKNNARAHNHHSPKEADRETLAP
jgi:hypothetical protein